MWPADPERTLVSADGLDLGFWIQAVQAVAFTALVVLAFSRLEKVTRQARPGGSPLAFRPR